MAIFKALSLISVLLAVVIGAYLYVSHARELTPADNNPTSSSVTNSAGNAVDNFNKNSQQELQQAQSQLGQ
jgi:hypothetical protein